MTCPISSIMIHGCEVVLGYGDYVLRYVASVLLLLILFSIYYLLSIVYSNTDLSDIMYNDPRMLINMYVCIHNSLTAGNHIHFDILFLFQNHQRNLHVM
jgi:hypothetical protein